MFQFHQGRGKTGTLNGVVSAESEVIRLVSVGLCW